MPAIVLVLVAGVAIALLVAAVRALRRRRGAADGDPGPWHRHVSPIFFLLVVAAGVMIGFVVLAVALNFVS